MKVKDLIKKKGFEVIAVDGDTPVSDATMKMIDRNIGALLVMEEGRTQGMFTERDVLKCWANKGCLEDVPIREMMSKNLIVVDPEDEISYVMSIMIKQRVRHLPVVEKGRVIAVLSMRDVVKVQVSSLEAEVHYLKDFITETG